MEEKEINFIKELDALCKRYNMSDGTRTDFILEVKELIKDNNKDSNNFKPFDLEAAKAGNPVYTRDGRKVRIICFDSKNNPQKPIIALIENKYKELLCEYTIKGKERFSHISTTGTSDLMMLPEKKEGWVNVYYNKSQCLYYFSAAYKTKEEALDTQLKTDCIDTIKVEWEE